MSTEINNKLQDLFERNLQNTQSLANLQVLAQAVQARIIAMTTENELRKHQAEAQAYTSDDFFQAERVFAVG